MHRIRSSRTASWWRPLVALLLLRAIVPVGYMPGSIKGDSWFELCPDGLPQNFVAALKGEHHHHGDSDSAPGVGECAFGDMLSPQAADTLQSLAAAPICAGFERAQFSSRFCAAARAVYRSRAPPFYG